MLASPEMSDATEYTIDELARVSRVPSRTIRFYQSEGALPKPTIKGRVAPEEVDLSHPLAGIMDATNAITITTDALGDVTIVGPGAGRIETGYSALVDIIAAGGTL